MNIKPPIKIEIKKSPIHGNGVFSVEKISEGEIIEVCPFIVFPQKPEEKLPVFYDYSFCWPRTENWTHHAFVLGYGALYNHSEEPNASWYTDNNSYVFYALEDIEIGCEILTNYGNGIKFP